MKRLGIFLFVLVLGYIFYYDIKIGTLPMLSSYKKTTAAQTIKKEETTTKQSKKEETDVTYKAIEVKTGETVLSITEQINKKKIPSIEKVIDDFKQLNKSTSATKIQIGKTYKFPLYQ
ncbi:MULTISPECIES: hypothetical protein [Bacillus]|uniref:LysM domain-containing protein n=5 Tax=Bacillus toyonensis TaxID=155322 RepID=A0A1V6LLZ5_9BACI|nr:MULTISPECIES: hypothetical protein [Bacillus]EJR67225.1 hypothetical protein IIO_00705 [Bacillus cereus VD115]EOP22560.1 hypothetical protein IIS_03528 [Bacillus cereus VD131]KAB0446542.1 hypothetical protein CH334_20510 [Lysinibacillus sp. VIA-II-2016]KNH39958.1 hypothetical protein ACS75_14705 [Bacillus thuringiensis]KXY19867.1 hypothetical protein AT259_18705 [Bacillus cereus]MDH8702912.1 hypothetical protein [Stenotrophomonas sp. 1198]OTX08296.1 hypothetical protein BK712_11025 [Bacil